MSAENQLPESPSSKSRFIPPCRKACPAGIDVPRYIRHMANGDFQGALSVIREKIPFPAVCGYACVHPCEAACARRQYDEALAIRELKRAAEAKAGSRRTPEQKGPATGKKVAVAGSGPCGLTAAYYLALAGHEVTVFEARPRIGGMLRYGIPGYRLPDEVVEREIRDIESCGVRIQTGAAVADAAALLTEFDAVLVASGAWKSLKMGLEGETSPSVFDGLEFLSEVNDGHRPAVGKKAVVIGGGNTAVDAARACVRLGAETVVIYRRNRDQMPALAKEVTEAEEEGVRLSFLTMPVRMDEGKLTCMKTKPGETDETGRKKPVPVEGSAFDIPCDSVVVAVGQAADAGAFNLPSHADGTAVVDSMRATPVKGVFAAGDVVSGPKTIIDAIAQGRIASVAIDRFLGGKGKIDQPEPARRESGRRPRPEPRVLPREHGRKLSIKKRTTGFAPVEYDFGKRSAVREARRCLACDIRSYRVEVDPQLCKGCGYCREICSLGIFSVSDGFNSGGYKPFVAENPRQCVGCLKCVYICPDLAVSVFEELK